MDTLTTHDCKVKLVELYPGTLAKYWKRTKKYLNEKKGWERVFEYTQPGEGRTVVLLEQAGGLSEVTIALTLAPVQPEQAPKLALCPLPTGMQTLTLSKDMNRLLRGASAPEPLVLPFVTPFPQETQFLLVLQNTIDWNAPQKSRACFDYAKVIDLKNFVARCTVQGIDILGSFLIYMGHQIDHLAGLDEDCFLDIGARDYDDSLADVIDVLSRLRQAFVDNKWDAPLDVDLCNNVFKKATSLKEMVEDMYSPDDEEAEETFSCIGTAMMLMTRLN
jgi:hypothetical protein